MDSKSYVKPTTQKARIELLDYLESRGFRYPNHTTRENSMESSLPIVVDTDKREVYRMGNITVAACAAACNALISEKEFYQQSPTL